MIVISVVRDFEIYNRFVKNNKFYEGATFVAFDNLKENKTIPERYNSFLETYDYSKPDWFVFCHEDWQLKSSFVFPETNAIYGPIGIGYGCNILFNQDLVGQIANSHRDGTSCEFMGKKCDVITEVGTIDCQCIIVHSSLIEKYSLRFDENLSFDLYAEDFCINAREKFGIPTKILPLECQHYSYGKLTERFALQHKYLQKKYKHSRFGYITPCSFSLIGGGYYGFRLLYKICRFLYRKKTTLTGKVKIRILGITFKFSDTIKK